MPITIERVRIFRAVVFYTNCDDCNEPLLDEESRRTGHCGCDRRIRLKKKALPHRRRLVAGARKVSLE